MPSAPSTLAVYQEKRKFSATPEPAGDAAAGTDKFSFVVQKHWASHLHYDFRLELDGVLKSWAVPKGPSLDPADKRMAVQVEDHPVAYAAFEGTIPPKQYGAGKVIVWDQGQWRPLGDAHEGFADGNLKFELRGHKLKGKWVLVRMRGRSEKRQPWLLIKEADEFARPAAKFSVVDEMPDSVACQPAGRKQAPRKAAAGQTRTMPPGAVKATLPATLKPQLATLATALPPSAADWLFEIKFDGYRLLTRIDGKDIRLFTRNGNDWTHRLAPLHIALAQMKLPDGWYDGEIVVQRPDGLPDFAALQQAFDAEKTHSIVLYLFDLPYCDGHDLRAAMLQDRRGLLEMLLGKAASEKVRFSQAFDAGVDSVVASACRLGLEGIVAKRRDAAYTSFRSDSWVKLKCGQRQEFVVGGYTAPQGARTGLGALLLGVYDDDGALQYAGKVGTGFNEKTLTQLQQKLAKLQTESAAFAEVSDIDGRPHWVQPKLVVEVSFGEWTPAGRIRHAVFQGLRADKKASAVVKEQAVAVAARKPASRAPASQPQQQPPISHPDRVIDAASGMTKLDVVRYYGLVSSLLLPHLKGRPVSLVRAPDGVSGELFFQKHAETEKLPGIRQLDAALDPEHAPLLEVFSAQGLRSAAQWNGVELHTRNFIASVPAHPDRMVFDLDPGEGVTWARVQEAAEVTRAFLQQLELASFLKTSGGKGLHVVVPLRRVHDWDTVKGFSHAIVSHLAQIVPARFVAKSGPKNRVGKIFIDYLRNSMAATTVSAWSARARPGLGISVPVAWDELGTLKGGDHWRVATVHTRLDHGNGPWQAYASTRQSLGPAMKKMNYQPKRAD